MKMPITQVNVFVCEKCGKSSIVMQGVIIYDDPVVTPPIDENWAYFDCEGKELLGCPECLEKYGTAKT